MIRIRVRKYIREKNGQLFKKTGKYCMHLKFSCDVPKLK